MPRTRTLSNPGRLATIVAATVSLILSAMVALAPESGAAVAATADWQFQNSRASSVPGAPALTDIGVGNTFVSTTVDGVAGRRVLAFPKGNGLQVTPLTGLVSPAVYSVVLLYKPTTTTGYQRILDFNNGVGETGLYSLDQKLVAYPTASGTQTPITSTAFHQVVLTRTGGKVVTGYVNGAKQFTFTDTSDSWLASGPNIRFFKDNSSEEGAGQVARIRLFNSALTAAQVSSLDRLPTTSADLAASLTDAPDPVLRGALLAYTGTVVNNGPASAAAASMTFTLPTGVSVVGSSPSVGTCGAPAGRTVTCSLGTLSPSATAVVLIVVNAPATTGPITGSVALTSGTPDSNAANNTASSTTTVR